MNDKLNSNSYFPSNIYTISKLNFLDSVKLVFDEFSFKQKEIKPFDPLYPMLMTQNFSKDYRIKDFLDYILILGKSILISQGYDMEKYNVVCDEIWGQEYYKYGGMEEHIHGNGSQISGFYFLNCPLNGCKLVLHDPGAGKKQSELLQKDFNSLSESSNSIYFYPEVGTIYLINSWLPHSFSRNGSEEPCKFIHFNLNVTQPINSINSPIIV